MMLKDESRLSPSNDNKKSKQMENEKIEKVIRECEILPKNFIEENNINAEYLGSASIIDNQRFTVNIEIYWLTDYQVKKWQYM